jgi:hypothetical protein
VLAAGVFRELFEGPLAALDDACCAALLARCFTRPLCFYYLDLSDLRRPASSPSSALDDAADAAAAASAKREGLRLGGKAPPQRPRQHRLVWLTSPSPPAVRRGDDEPGSSRRSLFVAWRAARRLEGHR